MSPNLHQRQPATRGKPRGFTLVELLVVMVILAILSGMVLMALSNTQASARDARTRATITKLDTLLMAKWETYQTRRVPLKPSGNSRTNSAAQRVDAIRDIMRMELPDQHDDISTGPKVVTARPAASQAYLKRYNASSKNKDWEGAECLYLIVAYGLNDPDALSQFNESEIGDFDKDGLPEFWDGWGQPISFMRWAPELDSPIQKKDATNSHDPFDPMKQYANAYALYPLICSGGPDKVLGIQKNRPIASINDPYAGGVGQSLSDESLDNITNHQIQDY